MKIQGVAAKCGYLAIAMSLLATTSCGKKNEPKVAFIAASMELPYNAAVAKGVEQGAKALGIQAVVLDGKGSVEKQGNAVDDLIAQGVKGIAMIPLDSTVATTWVDRAAEQNIPFVSTAAQIGDPDKVPLRSVYKNLTALVATDDILAGERIGQYIAKNLAPAGQEIKIGVAEGAPGYAVPRQRNQGLIKGLKAAGVKYRIVASQPTEWTPETGEAVCQNILTAHPDVNVLVAHYDDIALGCARAIAAHGSKAKLVSIAGGGKLGGDAIRAGEMEASICTRPLEIGRNAAKAMFDASSGKNTKKAQFIEDDPTVITKGNLKKDCPEEW